MIHDKKTGQTAIVAALVAAALLSALAFLPATASAQDASSSTDVTTTYGTSYADTSTDFGVQSQYHIYKPGDTVTIQGSMSSDMKDKTEAKDVSVKVTDAQGQIIADQKAAVDSSGRYSATINLPSNAKEGEYTINSKIEASASVLGLLSADIVAKMESSAQFIVGTESSFEVKTQGGEQFTVDITSNSQVTDVKLDEQAKKISFNVEGETGTKGAAEVTIPKAMLSGNMMVMIDGQAMANDDVIVKSQTASDVTFEMNYHHSKHTVDVAGTNVVPEFPMSALVMAAAISSVVGVMVAAKAGRFGGL
ncbi:MAG: MG2 domain-containing protein [Nitrososphaera sp.]